MFIYNRDHCCLVFRLNDWQCHQSSVTSLNLQYNCCSSSQRCLHLLTYCIDGWTWVTVVTSCLQLCLHYQSSAHCHSYQPSWKTLLNSASAQETNSGRFSHYVWDQSKQLLKSSIYYAVNLSDDYNYNMNLYSAALQCCPGALNNVTYSKT